VVKEEKIEREIEKITFSLMDSLIDGKMLVSVDLQVKIQVFFERTLSDTSNNWRDYTARVLNRLEDSGFLVIQQEFNSVYFTISKGLDFEEWQNKIKGVEKMSEINIGTVNASNMQVGNGNTQENITNISISELAEKISKSGDEEAKSQLKSFLNNSTVGSLIGAGVSSLISILQ